MIRRILLFFFVATGSFAEEIHFLVMPEKVIGPISPYIYGLNSQDPTGTGATFRRAGGNRTTAYNWVTNYSNAGNDYRHVNDNWPCTVSGYTDCDQVGAQTLHFVEENLKDHVDTLISVPMVDYVSADRNMDVTKEETAPSKRFKRNLYQKKGPFTLTPDPSAPAVYQDEFVNFLVNRFHTAAQGGVKFYSLDNEPDLWSDTHPRVHPEKITYAELADRSERLATAILGVDPTAQILGFISYGWMGFTTLQDASDRKEYEADFPTFIDYFLDKMKQAEARHKKRLVHILDLHWYPEAQGDGKRITDKGTSSGLVEARLQAPRSLWDPTYTEKSWIADNLKKPIQLLPMVQSKIAERYPGTKLGITEYDYGAGGHVSGGMAQADALGAFGKGNVYMASYWGDLKP